MPKKGIPQEGLKLLACVTMLVDHIGAALVPWAELRIVGRLAFPIYCFLLAEGVARTRSPVRYGLRLGVGAVLSEIPFDLLLFGGLTMAHQSVMLTLLLGFLALEWAKKMGSYWLPLVVCFLAAEWLRTDYGGWGVAMIGLFALTRELPRPRVLQTLGLAVICWMIGGMTISLGPIRLPIEMFALGAMVPICLYSGEKITHSRAVQWGFYLFYPVHLIMLLIICRL